MGRVAQARHASDGRERAPVGGGSVLVQHPLELPLKLPLGVGLGREGDPADLMYIGVLAVGSIGAIIARFQPHGMARALLATALAQALVAVIGLIAGMHQAPYSSVGEILSYNGFFVALFLGSAWLFRSAAREQTPAGAGPEG